MTGVDKLTQGMAVGGQLAEPAAEGVDEQDHQRAPEAIMDRPGHPVGVPGSSCRVERRSPDPGGGHTGRAHAETDMVAGYHKAGGIFFFLANQQGQQVGTAVEGGKQ